MGFLRRRRASTMSTIVAAGQLLEREPGDKTVNWARKREVWQSRAWDCYDAIGEVRQAARSMGDVFARVPWYVGVVVDPTAPPVPLDPDEPLPEDWPPELAYTPDEADEAIGLLEDLESATGGASEIRRQIGVSLFVPGECFLVGEETDDGERTWTVRSTDELKFDQGAKRTNKAGKEVPKVELVTSGGKKVRDLSLESYISRIWRPHPRFQELADSPMRAALEILEELLILTRAIQGAALSRTAGRGIMFLPKSVLNSQGPQQGDGQAARTNSVVTDIISAASLAISDPASPAAQLPFILGVNDEAYERLTNGKPLLQWDREVDKIAAEQRHELLRRFANSIDWPAELLLGKEGLNHWTAWLLRDEAFQSNVEPLLVLMCDALTRTYLRPSLELAGFDRPERFAIWYQPVGVVSDPDQGAKALKANDALLISWERARRDLGYTEDDAPSEEELRQRIAIQSFIRNPALGQIPSLDGEAPPPQQNGQNNGQNGQQQSEPMALLAAPGPIELGTGLADLPGILSDLDRALFTEVHQRADAAMRRVLERANARLRTLALRDKDLRSLLEGVDPGSLQVAPTLGPALVDRLIGMQDEEPDEDLFTGGFAGFLAWYDARLARTDAELLALMAEEGLPPADAEPAAADLATERARSAEVLGVGLLALATARLLRPEPLGPPGETDGLLVPAGLIRGALTTAGGGGESAAGLVTGDLVMRLWRRAGVAFDTYVWRYGDPAARTHPFEPHRRLNGARFTSRDDDRLGNAGYGWPGVSHYWPGDHPGCLCTLDLVAPRRIRRAPLAFASENGGAP